MAVREIITPTKLRKFLSGPAPDRDAYLRSADGFGVRRFKKSGRASFIVEAKVRGQGKTRRVTIGPAEPELLTKAKDEARVIVARLRSGEDVTEAERAAHRRSVAQRVTLASALDEMLEAHSGRLKPETLRMYRTVTRRHAGPLLRKRVGDITIEHVRNQLRKVEASVGQATARKLRASLSAVIGFAITEYALPMQNPVREIKGVAKPVAGRVGFVPDNRIGQLVTELYGLREKHRTHGNYLLFVLASGCRKNEAMKLKWEDVDWLQLCFTFRDTKNGRDHTLPITCWVDTILRDQLKARVGNCPWVFPGRVGGTHLTDVRKTIERNLSPGLLWKPKQEAGRTLQLHDLRRTAATHMEGSGIPKDRVSMILNHKGQGITDKYIQQNFSSVMDSLESYHRWLLRTTDNISDDGRRVRRELLTGSNVRRLKRFGVDPHSEIRKDPSLPSSAGNVIAPDYWHRRSEVAKDPRATRIARQLANGPRKRQE